MDSEARKEKWSYYKDHLDEAIEVHCFGTDKFEIVKGPTLGYVKIYNEKINMWQDYPCRDYHDICSICGKLMHVFYMPGTTWLAACSSECYEEMHRIRTSPKPAEKEVSQ